MHAASAKRKLAIGSDHAGYALKEYLKKAVTDVEWIDEGTSSSERTDYPDYAEKVGHKIRDGAAELGVLVCGSGIGMCIAANKIQGVRAAVVESETSARLSRAHNDANVLCLGARLIAPDYAKDILGTWLRTPFEGGRHADRVRKMMQLEGTNHDARALKKNDPEIAASIEREDRRQHERLELIASENYVSPAVLEAQGSVLTNKYAEGYPGKRYYGGCEFVDEVETLAIRRVTRLFGAEAANVQPHSGSQANMAAYLAFMKPGDKILGMNLSHGGHLTHGSPVNFSGRLFNVVSYGVQKETGRIDYNEVRDLAKREKPAAIVAGASAYPRILDFEKFGAIANEVGAKLVVDMAHIAGLVATGLHPSPVPHAHYVTSTTHKTLRGPRGGLILCKEADLKTVNSQIFPGIQGGPLMHVIAAKAVAFGEALSPAFKEYCTRIVKNCKVLAETLVGKGYHLVSGGTDNHLVLVDLSNKDITGKEAEHVLELAGITVNKNTVPFETKSPFIASGIRIGVPAITTRGLNEAEVRQIALWIDEALMNRKDERKLGQIAAQVRELCLKYPLYKA